MLVLVPSPTHIWERVIPDGGVHCHWKEPSLATVQVRLAADTTLSGPGGTGGSIEGGCRNVIGRGATNGRYNCIYCVVGVSACTHIYTTLQKFSAGEITERYKISCYNVGRRFTLKCDSAQASTH